MKYKLVIMAGGSGTRLWPLSRQQFPKQFIKIFDGLSSLQLTLLRHKNDNLPTIIINKAHQLIVQEQLREINIQAHLIIEPCQKNTAPCAIIGALIALNANLENVLLIPADHYIKDIENYRNSTDLAIRLSKEQGIAIIGITPSSAHTGYGYIQIQEQINENCFVAEKFIEKPNFEKALSYFLESGNYLWNSGMFAYNAKYLLKLCEQLQPTMLECVKQSLINAEEDLNCLSLAQTEYALIEPDSIDYALMEKLDNIAVVKANFDWSDLGSWSSLWDVSEKDENNNYLEGSVIIKNVSNSIIKSDSQLVTVLGLKDIVVVSTRDALLVAEKNEAENIKLVVGELSKDQRREAIEHVITYRPWGYYFTIDEAQNHKVKRIVVRPNHRLSYQYHDHRAEHWVVVAGEAEVIINDEKIILKANQSIYIPKLSHHRLTNIGKIDLHLIEVQTGEYLGEDDITRISDDYGRSK